MYYKNEYQRLDKNKERNGRLENRLKELSDSCVNGFLFSDLNDLNYQFLKNIPEILDDLLTYLDLDEIKTKYVKRSTGLRVSIIVNIDDLILDDYASITSKFQKSEYILREIFYYLSDSNNYINPIIRLKDEKNVYNHEILEIKEI